MISAPEETFLSIAPARIRAKSWFLSYRPRYSSNKLYITKTSFTKQKLTIFFNESSNFRSYITLNYFSRKSVSHVGTLNERFIVTVLSVYRDLQPISKRGQTANLIVRFLSYTYVLTFRKLHTERGARSTPLIILRELLEKQKKTETRRPKKRERNEPSRNARAIKKQMPLVKKPDRPHMIVAELFSTHCCDVDRVFRTPMILASNKQ